MKLYPDWLYDDPNMEYFPPIDDPKEMDEFSLLEEEIFDSGFMPIPEKWFFTSDNPNPLDTGLNCTELARDIYDYQISNRLLEMIQWT